MASEKLINITWTSMIWFWIKGKQPTGKDKDGLVNRSRENNEASNFLSHKRTKEQ